MFCVYVVKLKLSLFYSFDYTYYLLYQLRFVSVSVLVFTVVNCQLCVPHRGLITFRTVTCFQTF